ncbi:MAG TPA: DNA repair protein RecO [Burkholderiales bacterium]|nr:DNA repair protein RecO [Burkholderiales bacterium]
MAAPGTHRAHAQPAYVLHSYPYRESSLVVEAFTRDCGRIALVARGARRQKSALRGVLLAFQPLLLSWSGRGELRTLTGAEWDGPYAPLKGRALVCGFYLNELLLKFLARDDPHERLYATYAGTLAELAREEQQAATLRRFEVSLLRELGYAVTLDRDVESGEPIQGARRYRYLPERGPVAAGAAAAEGVELAGQTLLDMQAGDYTSAVTLQQSRTLMRALINHHLGGQVLHTRRLLRDLQEL